MSVITVDTTGTRLRAPAGPATPGSPLWIQPRPRLTRSATLAGDLLTALGKRRDLHGKGRNTHQDIDVAVAWIRATDTSDIVVLDAQTLHPTLITGLCKLARAAGATLWLAHQPPINDATHRTLTRVADRTACSTELPAPRIAPRPTTSPPSPDPGWTPRCDFTSYRHTLTGLPEATGLLAAFDAQYRAATQQLAAGDPVRATHDALLALLADAPSDDELIPRLRAIQTAAWAHDLHIRVDLDRLLASQERPRHTPAGADPLLLGYRQPHRALIVGLTLRRVGLADIAALTLSDVTPTGDLTIDRTPTSLSAELRTAARAQHELRTMHGATSRDALIPLTPRTMATCVNDAATDLGINTAGRRVERHHTDHRWLTTLGITTNPLP